MQTQDNPTEGTTAVIGRWTIATIALILAWVVVEPLANKFGIWPNFGSVLTVAVFAGFAISVWWPGWVKAGFRATAVSIVLCALIFGGFGVGVIWLITLGAGH